MNHAVSSCKIEILSASLLDEHSDRAQAFLQLSKILSLGMGWHYLLDFIWTSLQLDLRSRTMVLDAGAGFGLFQWWLAEQGLNVISVDRMNRNKLPSRILKRYRVQLWQPVYLRKSFHLRKLVESWKRGIGATGTIYLYSQDLSNMPDIEDESVDQVVSISALEHNTPEHLRACIMELMRILKPGGRLIATIGAADKKDWFHEPSAGWCFTEATLRNLFYLSKECSSNYNRYHELFVELRNCNQLRENLADFYFKSGNNGMPWGVWDPKYLSVGVVKVK